MSASSQSGKEPAEKFRDVYNLLSEAHQEPDTLDFDGASVNQTSFYATVGAAAQGNVLLEGPPGHGKTTLSELTSSLAGGVPLGIVKDAKTGPSDENEAGTLHLGKLQEGEEEVLFNKPAFLPDNIIDELNRKTPEAQRGSLEQVDRNRFEYNGQTADGPDGTFFATQNPSGQGTMPIPEPLKDRFDVLVQVGHPGHLHKKRADLGSGPDLEETLKIPEYETQFENVLESTENRMNPEGVKDKLENLRCEYAKEVEQELSGAYDMDISLPTTEDRKAATREIEDISLSPRADVLLRYVDHRLREEDESMGGRATQSARKFASAAAWLLGDEEAGLDITTEIIPDVYEHRVGDGVRIGEGQNPIEAVIDEYRESNEYLENAEKVWRRHQVGKIDGQEAHNELQRIKGDVGSEADQFVEEYIQDIGGYPENRIDI